MTRPRSRRLLTLLAGAGALTVVVLGGVYWRDVGAWLRFYWFFESVGVNEQGYPEYRHRETGIVMVRVPGGTFLMGSPGDEVGRDGNESLRKVTLRPFLIAKYEVSQREWERTMGNTPSRFPGDDSPVEQVSWEDCQEFCKKVDLSFPMEAQWEYACRAGSQGPFAGTGKLDDMGWYRDDSGNTTHPVGQKQPNGFGLHDMHGNVWEWCEDAFDEFSPGYRMIRGGSWQVGAQHCRSAFRYGDPPWNRLESVGLRPAFYPLPPGL